MIEIKKLCKNFGSVKAVDNLSVKINQGEIFALLGLNGAGKSTTIKILCGLTGKDSGEVIINGQNLETAGAQIKQIINLSPQETAVAGNLTVLENLKFIASLYEIPNTKEKIENLTNQLGLEAKVNTLAKKLSGGQKRKLSLAMALITSPQILILDEPTLGLDIKSRKALWQIILEQKKKTTIILTTHYLEEAETLADNIAIMSSGKLMALGTAQEIIEKSKKNNFEDAFLYFAGGEDE